MAETGSFTVIVDCGNGNDYDGRLGVRISSIFVIGFGSLCGALLPVLAARTKRMHVPKLTFFIAKYFGSGVIIATAFIHLLAPAADALSSPCLSGPITEYDWAEGIALMTIFTMFFIELLAARFDFFGEHEHDVEARDPAMDLIKNQNFNDSKDHDVVSKSREGPQDERSHPNAFGRGGGSTIMSDMIDPATRTVGDPYMVTDSSATEHDISYPPGGEDHLGHRREHPKDNDMFAAQMTALFILEFGVIFHSIFIGLTLAVAGSEFNVLYIVLVFHQTFEGLGLGSRLATAEWPKRNNWMPYVLGAAYGLTTPIAIAIGLGVRTSLQPNSPRTTIINGVFDSISAGILIYTGLVELMAHEFMFNTEMRRSSIKITLAAFGCMCLGAGLMALLGKWA